MSASLVASAASVAPAAVNSSSGIPDAVPAPGCTTTWAPRPSIFFTVSGVAATRGSAGSISRATAMRIQAISCPLRAPPLASATWRSTEPVNGKDQECEDQHRDAEAAGAGDEALQ